MRGRVRAVLVLMTVLGTFALSLFFSGGSLSALPSKGKVSDPEIYDRIPPESLAVSHTTRS